VSEQTGVSANISEEQKDFFTWLQVPQETHPCP